MVGKEPSEDLSGALPRGQRDKPRANWTVDQGKFMENVTVEDGPENVLELALVDVNNRELAHALTRAITYGQARRMLWRLKCAAATLLGVKELDPNKPPPMNGVDGICYTALSLRETSNAALAQN